ncbi:gamma carbonic anhydrase family protein [Pelagibaculum spongiae]|uniref:Gamma carbonic anhydrase family protein n=1 Tax=Pelagibaculum spongiae TaxID=2080658 RepID=A0A2V1GTD2_9GAMM|nr:gamma carbonic anhydrase family protein [Pelagibaculum spongiae]PVZ64955.1 gamma carbonic anhydrase family protein [Pelagibaculum spongiae]
MNIRSFAGKTPQLEKRVWVDPQSTVIGEVSLADDVSVWPAAVIRGDMHWIKVGARTSVQDGAILHVTHASDFNPGGFPLDIGEDVTIGHQACLHGCKIGNRVLIGMQAMVMDGVIVEDDVMIAAGSLVSPGKRLESGYLYRGQPARQARPLTDQEKNFLKYSPQNYRKLKDQYLQAADA